MAIQDRNLKVGTRLTAKYKGETHEAEVVETTEGVRYRLADGRDFTSPSSAGSAVMGGTACNGWRFWSVAGQEPKAKPTKASTRASKKAAKKNGNGLISRLEDGRYFCSACQEAFDAPKDVEPQGCPRGHTPEDFAG